MKHPIRSLFILPLIFASISLVQGNPTGGVVVAGTAGIAGQGTSSVTISQATQTAILNWQSFSIGGGEITKFIQPSSSSATLNRVLGGQTSIIDGTLSANGQIYLINGNGILVGAGGVINTSGFTASTRDISNSDFLSGHLHFTGDNDAGVQNLGSITALGGDVVLIGKTVDNQGTIEARGTAGLVAGDDVYLAQQNTDGSTITVIPVAAPSGASTKVGVHNSGVIHASSAELKAANGNIYALAIQNEGSVRATTLRHQGGHIYLTSDTGTLVNSGTLDASAKSARGNGGSVTLKNMGGTTIHTGQISATGGSQGGNGGSVEVSGEFIGLGGTVTVAAPHGVTGNILLDPRDLTITSNPNGTANIAPNNGTDPNVAYNAGGTTTDGYITPAQIQSLSGNIHIQTDRNLTVASSVTLTGAQTLTLEAGDDLTVDPSITITAQGITLIAASPLIIGNNPTGAVSLLGNLNAGGTVSLSAGTGGVSISGTITASTLDLMTTGAITQTGGKITASTLLGMGDSIDLGSTANAIASLNNVTTTSTFTFGDTGTFSIPGTIAVGGFVLTGGTWLQNSASLPGFTDTGNFELQGTSTFKRFAGGTGTTGNPYQIVDVYGLQGIASPSNSLLGNSFVLNNDIDATGTVHWNNSAGFVPIGSAANPYTGTFNGQGHVINGLTIHLPNSGYVGLFGETSSLLENVGLTNVNITGNAFFGGLVGLSTGTVETSYATGTVTGSANSFNFGGLVGENSGTVETSYATGTVNSGVDSNTIGGLVGYNTATVETSYATGTVTGGVDSNTVGGLVGFNTSIVETSYATGTVTIGDSSNTVGGLVGYNTGTVETSYATGTVAFGDNSNTIGGLVGFNTRTVADSYWEQDSNHNAGLYGIGSPQSNTGASPETLAQLQTQATFQPAGASPAAWDFTLGTGTWGINGYTNVSGTTTQINNGLPYFQWQYPTYAAVKASNQTVHYNGTSMGTGFSTSAYTVTYATGYNSLNSLVSSGPTVGVSSSNVNVGTPDTISVMAALKAGVTLELMNGTETITPAPLTITADDQTKVYGAALPTLTASYTGFVNGETSASLNTAPTLSTTATASSSVAGSPYTIMASGAVDGNYTISYVSGALRITAAPLTIMANNQSKVYGAALPTLTASYTGFVNGDTSASLTTAPTLSTTATAASHVAGSPYAINASNASDSNYAISYVSGNLIVTSAPLTITANNQSKVYGAALPTLTASYTGFVNGDTTASLTTAPTLSTTATASSSVAGSPYTIMASGAADSDYSISYFSGNLHVTAAPLTIMANNQSKVYGAALPTLTASYTGFVNGDTSASLTTAPILSTTATAASHVSGSPYAVNASNASDSNYTISYVSGDLSVTAAPLTITADDQTKVYGAPLPTLTASYTGFVNGDTTASLTMAPSLSTTATAASSVSGSPYSIMASGAADGDYSIGYVAGNLVVTPATLAYVAEPVMRGTGVPNPTFTGTVTGFVNGDNQGSATTGTLLFSSTATNDSLSGSYAIIGSGLMASNYILVQAPGNATALTVTGASSDLLTDLANFDAANDATDYASSGTSRNDNPPTQSYGPADQAPAGTLAFGSSFQLFGNHPSSH